MNKFFISVLFCFPLTYILAQQNYSGLHGYQFIHPPSNFYKINTSSKPLSAGSSYITGVSIPVVEWQKCYGGNNLDVANCVQLTPDGGFIVAGFTTSYEGDVMGYHGTGNGGDIWVLKLDKVGNIQWQKCYGGKYSEQGAYILPTPDGGYILTAGVSSQDCAIKGTHGAMDYWILKLDQNGNIIWNKIYGGSNDDLPSSITIANDGGYFVTGFTLSTDGDVKGNHGSTDYWVIKIDATGNLIWQKCLGGSDYDFSTSIQATYDGGCITAGTTNSANGDITGFHGAGDYWVVKMDKLGNIQWQKSYGGSMTENAFNIQLTNDGGYLVAGFANSFDGDVSGVHPSGFDAWLVKLDNSGAIQWQKCYGGSDNEVAYSTHSTDDGGYVVAGSSRSSDGDLSCNAGTTDAWVFKIGSNGDLEWQKNFGGNDFDEAYSVQELSDGSFITAGYVNSSNISGYHTASATYLSGISDYWIVKLSSPVLTPPNPVVKIDPASATVCAGGSSTIKVNVSYGGLNPIYQWSKNGLPVGINSPTYTSNFANNDQVTCLVTSSSPSCENYLLQGSDLATIKINNNIISPSIKIIADNTFICDCTTINFKANVTNGGGAPVYQWQVNGQNTGINTDVFTSNNLNVGDVITCLYYDNASCITNGKIISNAIMLNSYDGTPSSVSISALSDTICSNSSITFQAIATNAGNNPTYQWKINGVNAGANNNSFTTATLANGDVINCTVINDPLFACAPSGKAISNNISVTVLTKANPSVIISLPSDTVCSGIPVTFTASAMNAGVNPVYKWQLNGTNVGSNSSSFTTSALSTGDIISCSIIVDPLFTCALISTVSSKNKIITVKNLTIPFISITASANEICQGDTISFNAYAQNAGASPSYNWILNNAAVNDYSDNFTSNNLSNGDQLYCEITPARDACSTSPVSSNILTTIIDPLPTVIISPADTVINYGNIVHLSADASPDVSSYQWSNADKLIDPQSLHTTTQPLTENVIFNLTVENDKGCKASVKSVIKIFKALYMPNAFTPNGDGVNDIFKIPADVTIQLNEFSIYDRWGNLVFTTNNPGKGWDGTLNGTKLSQGAYVYYVKGSNIKGKIFLKGTVVLIR